MNFLKNEKKIPLKIIKKKKSKIKLILILKKKKKNVFNLNNLVQIFFFKLKHLISLFNKLFLFYS